MLAKVKRKELVLATHNQGKVKEIKDILGTYWHVQSLFDLKKEIWWEETGSTFIDNALIKARKVKEEVGSISVVAEDSGLVVPALDGAPGLYSARFAGPQATSYENNQKLLRLLANVPKEKRQAYFVTAMVYISQTGEESLFEGRLEGVVGQSMVGEKGFGYDPLFTPLGDTRSLAQYTREQKNKISHRGQALQKLLKFLRESDS